MRLIHVGTGSLRHIHVGNGALRHPDTLTFREFLGSTIPPYAILSHTWGDDEVTYKDFVKRRGSSKKGYAKIVGCAREAKANGIDYIWVDTCCIDKRSSAELTEAINSMYRWYQNSKICYVYMEDVVETLQPDGYMGEWRRSRWFTRGWTLQELIAPSELIFFSTNWVRLASRGQMRNPLRAVTGVPDEVFAGIYVGSYTVHERMTWASRRTTTRTEDMAYCLMGIFDINMPLLYGEGEKAFLRLQEQIIRQNTMDYSIFAWSTPSDIRLPLRTLSAGSQSTNKQMAPSPSSVDKRASSQPTSGAVIPGKAAPMCCGPLAESPSCFQAGNQVIQSRVAPPIEVSGADIRLTARLIPLAGQALLFRALLPIAFGTDRRPAPCLAIYVMKIPSVPRSSNDQGDLPRFVRVKPAVLEPDEGLPKNTKEPKEMEIVLSAVKQRSWTRVLPNATLRIHTFGLSVNKVVGKTIHSIRKGTADIAVDECTGKVAGLGYEAAYNSIVIIGLNSYGAPWCRIVQCANGAEESVYEAFRRGTYDDFEESDHVGRLSAVVWYENVYGALLLYVEVTERALAASR